MNKQKLLGTIESEAELWELFLNEVGEERMEQPGATGDWSFKDVVAHISTWRANTLTRLRAARQDQTPSEQFWPAGWDKDNDEDIEKINEWIYKENCDRSLTDVLNESRQQFRSLREVVRTLSEDELFDPDRFAWMDGEPLASLVSFGHFHEEHEAALRQWLAALPPI